MVLYLCPQVESALLDEEAKFEKALQFHERARTLLRLPKFRIESDHDLKPVLIALGLGNIFSSEADFSGIVGRKDLVVDQVIFHDLLHSANRHRLYN